MTDPRLVRMDAEDERAIRDGDPYGLAKLHTRLLAAYSEGITEEEARRVDKLCGYLHNADDPDCPDCAARRKLRAAFTQEDYNPAAEGVIVEHDPDFDTQERCQHPDCPPEHRQHDPLSACPWCDYDPLEEPS
jgi:hypothetical protein